MTLGKDTVDAYARLGVDRLILQPDRDAMRDIGALERFVRSTADQLGFT